MELLKKFITSDTNKGKNAYDQALIEGMVDNLTLEQFNSKSTYKWNSIFDDQYPQLRYEWKLSRTQVARLFKSPEERNSVIKEWFGEIIKNG